MSMVAERYRQWLYHCNTFLQLKMPGFEPALRSLRKRSFVVTDTITDDNATSRD